MDRYIKLPTTQKLFKDFFPFKIMNNTFIVLDFERHQDFYVFFCEVLKDLGEKKANHFMWKEEKQRKRKYAENESVSITISQNELYMKTISIIIIEQEKSKTLVITSDLFLFVVRDLIMNGKWTEKLKNTKDWWMNVPPYIFDWMPLIERNCGTSNIDLSVNKVFSLGRYIQLECWLLKNLENQKPSAFPSDQVIKPFKTNQSKDIEHAITTRMILWLTAASFVPEKEVYRYVCALEACIDSPNLLAQFMSLGPSLQHLKSMFDKYTNIHEDQVHYWKKLTSNLPKMVECFHGRPKLSVQTKTRLNETTTKTMTFQQGISLLLEEKLFWNKISICEYFKTNKQDISALLFTETTITMEQIHMTLVHLFEEWSKFWAEPIGVTNIKGLYKMVRTSQGVLTFLPTIWVTEIQERLVMYLCLHPLFRRRWPVPIAPWMTEKYFSENDRDREMVIKILYRLIHKSTRENRRPMLATPQEEELFRVYGWLHHILNHFKPKERITFEFQEVFKDIENLYFNSTKTQERAKEPLLGLKNISCLHRALKSFIEIKAPHFIDSEGIDILSRYQLTHTLHIPSKEGQITQDEMINIYNLCAGTSLTDDDALGLFYSVYTQGEILFSATLGGLENWRRMEPYLNEYNKKVLRKIAENPKRHDSSCEALFYCIRVAEEMVHYPVHVTRGEYAKQDVNFRGKFITSKFVYDPRDFVVNESRCPLMLFSEDGKKDPKTWFSTDLFPIHEGTLQVTDLSMSLPQLAKHLHNFPWKDLRPFDDAHSNLLEYLTIRW